MTSLLDEMLAEAEGKLAAEENGAVFEHQHLAVAPSSGIPDFPQEFAQVQLLFLPTQLCGDVITSPFCCDIVAADSQHFLPNFLFLC